MSTVISGELIDLFGHYIEEHLGLCFPKERKKDLEKALLSASRELGFQDAESCIRSFLLAPPSRTQIEVLASHLTVGETYFFRDRKSFDVLREHVLPDLIQSRKSSGRYLRIWSAGCASGEEPYSIAILLHSMIPDIHEWNISILATDINPSFLQKAARGIYGEWSFRGMPKSFKKIYFRKTEKVRYELVPEIRKTVVFKYHNLAEDIYPSLANNTNAMDLILCRNVLMYFSREGQREVSRKLYQSIVENGWLLVSPVEISAALFSPLVQVNFQGTALYRKCASETEPDLCTPSPDISLFKKEEFPETKIKSNPEKEWIFDPEIKMESEQEKTPPVAPPAPLYEKAFDLYEQGLYPEAEHEANLLLNSGDEARVLPLLARIYANQGKLDDALGACEKAISLDKLNPRGHYLLAAIQQEMGLVEESASSLKRVLYLNPDFILAYFSLGDIARKKGNSAESRRHFENALSVISRYGRNELVPESDGISAGRLAEIIKTNLEEIAAE